ncbi:hypothetical protein LguiB_031054 [Lonicera macranthoides]
MDEGWRCNPVKLRIQVMVVMVVLMIIHNFSLCWSLNGEGMALLKFRERVVRDPFGALSDWNYSHGESDHCSWFGVECSDGRIVILNLKDLCIGGTLAPELGKLIYAKSIILRNNSFYGNIPKEIGELKELEVLLDNNEFLGSISAELNDLKIVSESQVDKNQLTSASFKTSRESRSGSWNTVRPRYKAQRGLLQVTDALNPKKLERERHHKRDSKSNSLPPLSSLLLSPSPSPSPYPPSSTPLSTISFPPLTSIASPPESQFSSPSESLAPSPLPMLPPSPSPTPMEPPVVVSTSPLAHPARMPSSPASNPSGSTGSSSKPKHRVILIWSGIIGGSLFLFISAVAIVLCQRSKMVTVKPWATGLSGQLQKAFVTGVPKLQRSELETACEDFSNIIGTLPDGTVYKGTLSSGVEIAVTSAVVKSAQDWSKNLETQFRNKVETLSKMNHKNLVNLIGYCEEEEPFTRMMVYEYAPNGTLFEHLHVKEAEHLDWRMRLRITTGLAYCLDYMHQLTPPIAHGNLQSSSVYLTEDYAPKISDFSFWNEATAAKMDSATMELLETLPSDPGSNVYSFGVILFEMITGQLPYSVGNGPLEDWASDYLKGERPFREMVDPTLTSFEEEEFEKLQELVKDCVKQDPKGRLTMREVTARLKEITGMGPDSAAPKVSPLWWAELEILSTVSTDSS